MMTSELIAGWQRREVAVLRGTLTVLALRISHRITAGEAGEYDADGLARIYAALAAMTDV